MPDPTYAIGFEDITDLETGEVIVQEHEPYTKSETDQIVIILGKLGVEPSECLALVGE